MRYTLYESIRCEGVDCRGIKSNSSPAMTALLAQALICVQIGIDGELPRKIARFPFAAWRSRTAMEPAWCSTRSWLALLGGRSPAN